MKRGEKGEGRREKRKAENDSQPRAVILDIYVQPRASRTEVVGRHGDAIKIRIKAPPVDGAANAELIRFLAGRLGVPKSAVRIVSGVTGRKKRVAVEGVGSEQALLQAVTSQ